jgi:hypothetical protein
MPAKGLCEAMFLCALSPLAFWSPEQLRCVFPAAHESARISSADLAIALPPYLVIVTLSQLRARHETRFNYGAKIVTEQTVGLDIMAARKKNLREDEHLSGSLAACYRVLAPYPRALFVEHSRRS